MKAKLFLIAFGVTLALATAEFALWILDTGKGNTDFESADDLRAALNQEGHFEDSQGGGVSLKAIIESHPRNDIIYDLQPNLDVRFMRASVRTNSCGMRSKERPIGKPAHTYRIALLGDSFGFGWGVEQQESFAQRIEDNLNTIVGPDKNVEVLNFSVPGYSTFQEVAHFMEKGVAFAPDAVLVFFVENDFGAPFFMRNIGESSGFVPTSHLAKLAHTLVDPRSIERVIENAGLDPNHSLSILSDYTRKAQIPLFMAINPKANTRENQQKLWILKDRKDIRVMKIRDDYVRIVKERAIPSENLTLSFDPHPSPLRHAIYGDIMTPYLMSVIQ